SRRWSWAGLLACALAGCDRGGESANGPVQPVVLPPKLQRVLIEPPALERQVTQRVEVRDPDAVAAIQVDAYRQSDGVVDILWMVDQSGSMANERKRLGGNFQRL